VVVAAETGLISKFGGVTTESIKPSAMDEIQTRRPHVT